MIHDSLTKEARSAPLKPSVFSLNAISLNLNDGSIGVFLV